MQSMQEDAPQATGAQAPATRVAFERLRERTDELELIVSGLLAFALLTVPGRVFDAWAANAVHVEGVFLYALWFGFLVVSGLSYTLGTAFVVHLAIRGYWVGLIGLKSTFPDGIRWDRVPLMGPVSRAFYQRRVGDLGQAIDRVDRAASILFAMTILIALAIVWVGVLAVATILLGGAIGALFDDSARVTNLLLFAGYVLFIVAGLVPVVLEKLIARRQARAQASPVLERIVRALLRVLGVLVPQRLIMPVQLTLQSNLHGNGFIVAYMVVIMATSIFGSLQIAGSLRLAMVDRYDLVTGEAVEHGMLTAHYESLRSEHDVLLRYPMIPSDRISEAHLRLFIPHQPQRDNALARERCRGLERGRNAASGPDAARLAVTCVGTLWTATLDGQPVPLDGFVPMERRDLGLRGLVGYLDVSGLAPGRHDLRLLWNAEGGDSGRLRRREYFIPFWFTPGMELPATAR
ncbi:hypothetical protein [Luteimonas kalidii]|uniref:RDD domain-containing protein n=1 Tax=Luteimonas kalidii TaxID=3042025 RepID=A0ABT6JQK3_9GAMM|nr:hypothetical protein [Luteimonas kalidii]MDH5832785.1 hypothetical protein [Luteimonas kalidii]